MVKCRYSFFPKPDLPGSEVPQNRKREVTVSFTPLPVSQRLKMLLRDKNGNASAPAEFTYRDLGLALARRRDDPEFWAPLTAILKEVVEGAARGKSPVWRRIPQLKLLATWDEEELSNRLTEALPYWANEPSAAKGAACERPDVSLDARAAAFSAFLLLGLAAGCSNSSSSPNGIAHDAGTISTGGSTSVQINGTGGAFTCPYPATDAGRVAIEKSDAGIPSDCSAESVGALWDAVDRACLSDAERQAVLEEFSNLKAGWCNGLVELFRNESPEVIAAQLEAILGCGRQVLTNSEFTSEMQQRIIQGMLCPVILYKGVSFSETDSEN